MRELRAAIWAALACCAMTAQAAELNVAAFNLAWAGSAADFHEHIRVCASDTVNWCDARAKGAEEATPEEVARAKQCQATFDAAAGGLEKGLLVAPCNAYKLNASRWKGSATIYAEKLDGLRATVDGLIRNRGTDVIAFQEVRSAGVIRDILGTHATSWDVCIADHTAFQTVGFAWRRSLTSKPGRCTPESTLSIKESPSESASLRYLRPGLALTLVVGKDPVTLMNVHLKSGCANLVNSGAFKGHELTDATIACEVLNRQVVPLEAWIERVAKSSPLFVVLGDFNRRLDEEAAHSVPPTEVRKDHTLPASSNKAGPNGEVGSRFLWQELSDGDPTLVQMPPPIASNCKGFEGLDHILISGALNARQVRPLASEKIKVEQAAKQVIATSDHCPRITKLTL